MKYIKAFLKFSREEKFRDDILNGKLYCRSIEACRNVNDPFDSTRSVKCTPYGIETKLYLLEMPFSMQPIFCMYAWSADDEKEKITLKIAPDKLEQIRKDLGEYVTIILDVPEFINRLKNSRNRIWYGKCHYVQDQAKKPEYEAIEFAKNSRYAAEQEFRILVRDVLIKSESKEINFDYYKDYMIVDKCFFLNLGNLRDIAKVCSIEDLKKGLEINVAFNKINNSIDELTDLTGYFEEES